MIQTQITPAPRLRQARHQLVERGALPSAEVGAHVSQSWQRSLSAGLHPVGRLDGRDNLPASELHRLRLAHHELMSHSEPIMEFLYEQVRESHSMVILSDERGVLVQTLGDLDFLSKADRVALRCGASWAENQRGTNAIGTALAESRALEIHGAEHYLDRNGFLTCAASPIVSAQGQLLGILDISGEQRSRHPHTLGLVTAAARMIENNLILAPQRNQIVVMLHTRPEGLGSVAQGLLVLSEDGWILGGNPKGLEMVGLERASLSTLRWDMLFETPLDTLRQAQGITPVCSRRGQAAYARLHGRPHAVVSISVPAGPPAQEPMAPACPGDALAELDTGDLRWRAASDKARKVVDKGIPILVTGESGVGKEIFVRALHASSKRAARPLVAVNCAALPEHLIEAELFGYVGGSFTGASRQGSPGRIRESQGGTLFLDEIGDMPLGVQTRLLRVLQERSVVPVGSGTPVSVDFTLVCATHQDLRSAVQQGRFRSDLYYRINGLRVELPRLAERSDLDRICARMLREFSPDRALSLEPELQQALHGYGWPGNLRQLSHMLRTAVALLGDHEPRIGWLHLPDDLQDELRQQVYSDDDAASAQSLRDVSARAVQLALENTRGNVSAAARALGISRQTLYRKLQPSR